MFWQKSKSKCISASLVHKIIYVDGKRYDVNTISKLPTILFTDVNKDDAMAARNQLANSSRDFTVKQQAAISLIRILGNFLNSGEED